MANETKPLITRMVAGKEVQVDIDECWDSICKVLRIARMLTSPGGQEYQAYRLAMLSELLCDLEGLGFQYRRNSFFANIREEFVPAAK